MALVVGKVEIERAERIVDPLRHADERRALDIDADARMKIGTDDWRVQDPLDTHRGTGLGNDCDGGSARERRSKTRDPSRRSPRIGHDVTSGLSAAPAIPVYRGDASINRMG